MELNSLYQEVILDHYKRPHHKGLNPIHDVQVHHNNPSCGDEQDLTLSLKNNTVAAIGWDGVGCSISQASTSIMSEIVLGKTTEEVSGLISGFLEMIQSKGKNSGNEDLLQDAVVFAGVSKFPARVKCALLGWMALKDALTQLSEKMEERESMSNNTTIDDITEAMKDVIDPELGINVIDLGLVYDMRIDNDVATLDMTLTSAACPLQDVIEDQTKQVLADLVSDVKINWVWMPPWGPARITDDGREQLRSIGFTV